MLTNDLFNTANYLTAELQHISKIWSEATCLEILYHAKCVYSIGRHDYFIVVATNDIYTITG